jgi:hypothetical protein
MSENMSLRRIFGPKREVEARGWMRLHNVELYILYASPNVTNVIKPRRIRWAGQVGRMIEMHIMLWSENLKGRDHSEGLGVDGKTLEWVLGK